MSSRLSVATRKGLFVLEQRHRDWEVAGRHFLGESVTALLSGTDGHWLAALRLGHFGVKLRESRDDGAHWEERPVPVYPTKPTALAGAAEDPNPWSLDQIWTLVGHHRLAPRRLWAGTIPGGLFRSDDDGASWQLNDSLWRMPERQQWFGGGYDQPGIHSILVHPDDPDDIVVGVSCGGAWRSRDGGKTWSVGVGMRADFMPPERSGDPLIQDPHLVVQCASAPSTLWTQHHCGIFKSRDRGANWEEVTTAQPSAFGFAVAVDPADPDRAWFAPAVKDQMRVPVGGAFVVSHTRDGGASFEVLREGLPQSDAYHLVYRHNFAISADGQWLALASTTGALWLSHGGRVWQSFSRDLPPIYAVGFVD